MCIPNNVIQLHRVTSFELSKRYHEGLGEERARERGHRKREKSVVEERKMEGTIDLFGATMAFTAAY
jgi:hypothetical protein